MSHEPDRTTTHALDGGVAVAAVAEGTVRWFSPGRGFGFIEPDGGGDDVFVEQSHIVDGGFRTLDADERVTFERAADEAGPCARSVRRA